MVCGTRWTLGKTSRHAVHTRDVAGDTGDVIGRSIVSGTIDRRLMETRERQLDSSSVAQRMALFDRRLRRRSLLGGAHRLCQRHGPRWPRPPQRPRRLPPRRQNATLPDDAAPPDQQVLVMPNRHSDRQDARLLRVGLRAPVRSYLRHPLRAAGAAQPGLRDHPRSALSSGAATRTAPSGPSSSILTSCGATAMPSPPTTG